MAQREALRELQSRLAQRLQQVRAEPRGAAWLAVECAELGLLLPLAGAGEIFGVGTLLPVPHTQPWFVGVTSLRGSLHGVVDLAAFLGLRTPQPASSLREQARLLALNPACGAHCAVLVDRLVGLRGAEQMQAEPDDGTPKPGFAGPAWRDGDGRRWQEIDLAALAWHEQFLGIGT